MSRRHRPPRLTRLRVVVAGVLTFGFGLVGVPNATPSFGADAPHVLRGSTADVIVRVEGAAVCSGTPITGSLLVVTAAHCVLRHTGEVASVSVVRDGVRYSAVTILVDTRYHHTPVPALDAAVLVMERAIPGPSALLGDVMPDDGVMTLSGLQPVDAHGDLVRGRSVHDRVTAAERAAAGCREPAASLGVTADAVLVHCGLVPGASGGGLFADRGGTVILVGIVSTVADDLTYNRVVPLDSLHRLFDEPGRFGHTPTTSRPDSTHQHLS